MELIVPLSLQYHLEQTFTCFCLVRKERNPLRHGLGCWYENEDFNTEYFSSWSKYHDKLGDGCTIDFPIRLHNKLKWSSRTFIKQDDGQ